MARSIDEIWEDIQFDKTIEALVKEGKSIELAKLLVNGGLERLMTMIKERLVTNYRLWEILSVLPKPPTPRWEDMWVDGEDSEDFTVEEWERVSRQFCKSHTVTKVKLVGPYSNGKFYVRVYYSVKVRKRILANKNEIEKWVNSLTEEQRNFIIKLHDLVMEKNFEWELWLNNGDRDLTMVKCYWKLWKKFKPTIYRADEIWEDDHDREPYPHWVR
jgi:hypothetical protein